MAALPLLLRNVCELIAKPIQVIVKINQVVDEWFLERFVQKIVAILQQFGVQRIEELLIHTLRIANRSQLFVDSAELLGECSRS